MTRRVLWWMLIATFLLDYVTMDCPDTKWACPTGEIVFLGNCWSWGNLKCNPCSSYKEQVRTYPYITILACTVGRFGTQQSCCFVAERF